MKLQISTACQGHGRCYTLAPQLLSSDDEGYVTISGGDPIEVPEDMRELAENVVGQLPRERDQPDRRLAGCAAWSSSAPRWPGCAPRRPHGRPNSTASW